MLLTLEKCGLSYCVNTKKRAVLSFYDTLQLGSFWLPRTAYALCCTSVIGKKLSLLGIFFVFVRLPMFPMEKFNKLSGLGF